MNKSMSSVSHILSPARSAALALAAMAMAFAAPSVQAANFGSGNLVVALAGSSSTNTTASIVEVNTTSAGQTAIQTVALATNLYRVSGSATSTMYLASSTDGSLVAITVGKGSDTVANVNTFTARGVVTLDNAATVANPASYTGTTGNQTRCATTLNNSNWFIADQVGLYTGGATSASPTGNFRGAKSFGNTVYLGQASSTATATQIGTISATSGGTFAGLTGLTNNANHQDFYFIQSGSNGSTYDVLYVVSATSNTAGSIAKFSLVSGSWTANGTYTTTFGGFGLAAKKSGTGAELYVTTGQGALTANSVIKLTDTAGYNSTISITTANNVTLYTAGTGTILKGIAFAPVSTTPTITGATTAAAFTTTYGTASAAQTFSVSGSNLTANLVATAPTGFEVSSDGTTYGATATFTQSGGTASGSLRVRLAASAGVSGSYNSLNIALTSTGATTVNIATSSSGNAVSRKALTITAADQTVNYGTAVSTVTGNGSYTPTGFVNGDTSSVISGTATYTTTYTTTTAAGSNVATITPVTTSLTAANYSFTAANGNITVSAVVPGAPTSGTITAGDTTLSVAFTWASLTA